MVAGASSAASASDGAFGHRRDATTACKRVRGKGGLVWELTAVVAGDDGRLPAISATERLKTMQ